MVELFKIYQQLPMGGVLNLKGLLEAKWDKF